MMRRKLILLALVLGLCACESAEERDSRRVRRAAQEYYSALLIDKEYDEFLAGMVGTDSMPAAYREQLHALLRQYVAEQERDGNVLQITATADSLRGSHAIVFMDMMFGDSTVEQVSVKMVRSDDRWLME